MHLPTGSLADYLPHQAAKVYDTVENRLLQAPIERVLQSDYPNALPWSDPKLLSRKANKLASWRGLLVRTLESEEAFERFVAPGSIVTIELDLVQYQIPRAIEAYRGLIYVAGKVAYMGLKGKAEHTMNGALLERDPQYGWSGWSQLRQEHLSREIEFADEYLPKAI
ncbi:MAG: hypothetical protein ABI221_02965 [Candidatus Saccharimonadales bacterium]